MNSQTYVCPKCQGTQQTKSKCKQCGYKFLLTDDEFLDKIESGELEWRKNILGVKQK